MTLYSSYENGFQPEPGEGMRRREVERDTQHKPITVER